MELRLEDVNVRDRRLKRQLQAIEAGDSRAFKALYDEFFRQVDNYLKSKFSDKHLVDDLVQEVFLAIWKNAHKYNGQSSVATWVFSIVRYKMIDALRSKYKKKEEASLAIFEAVEYSEELVEGEFTELIATKLDIRGVVDMLPNDAKELIALVFDAGLSYKEIAVILDIPEGTVKSRVYSIKKTLKVRLQERGITTQ